MREQRVAVCERWGVLVHRRGLLVGSAPHYHSGQAIFDPPAVQEHSISTARALKLVLVAKLGSTREWVLRRTRLMLASTSKLGSHIKL